MRAGLSTIQQTLTPEAAAVLGQSIAEAHRRNHGQTTPLHVAATLLSSPSGYLRQACVRSHPNSSHPLQCRALELCFSVALERLPTAAAAADPPISNALMAALKRAQAHQRRGCPEQQQQPLLAVKVELDQLIVSILDDPSVSRVMREASFSSPAVKSAIEQSINTSNSLNSLHHHVNSSPIAPRLFANPPPLAMNRNVYLNPRLQPPPQPPPAGGGAVKKVVEIMLRSKKRNPILVGDSEPEAVVRDLLRKIESREFESELLKNVEVISMEKGIVSDQNQIISKMEELGGMVESKIGVILDLGDLKWVVAAPEAVVEVAKLVAKFKGVNKLWLIGTATCETYLRCQVYHTTMENDWDLQALPMASRTFPRLGSEKLLITPMEPLNPRILLPSLSRRASENSDPSERGAFCPDCAENYEKEVSKLTTIHKSFSESTSQASLPQWLQKAKLNTDDASSRELISKQKTQELQKKWSDICLHLHPSFHQNRPTLSASSLYNLTFHLMLQTPKPSREIVHLSIDEATNSPPQSPVRTDLVLGRKGTKNNAQKAYEDRARDLLSCVSSQPQKNLLDKFSNSLDADTHKKLLKGLMEKAWWQKEAASTVASAITSCRFGNGKRRGSASRGDIWLLFTGPDQVGKKKVASVIAEQICGTSPIMICLGARRDVDDSDTNFRGRTAIDKIAEVVRRNPFSVIVLQDIDEGDMLVRGSIKRAIERGRIADSHGREVNLGNCIFVLTGDWTETNVERDDRFVDEKKLASIAGGNWELGLVVRERSSKRNASWLFDDDDNRPSKRETASGLSLDLNLTAAVADVEEERTDGSDHNSSDLTIDHEEEFSHTNRHFSVPRDLLENVDETVVFKAVDSGFVRREIKKSISLKFLMMLDGGNSCLEIEDDVLDKIIGKLWHGRTGLQEWIETVIEPIFERLKNQLSAGGRSTVWLVVESDSGSREGSKNEGDWLPSSIFLV